MKKENKKRFLIVVGIFIFVIGFSYAYWSLLYMQESSNKVLSGCFDVDFAENTPAINLLDSFPISDEEGKDTTPFTFTLTNNCKTTAIYDVNIELLGGATGTNIDHNLINVAADTVVYTLGTDPVAAKINEATAYQIATGSLAHNATKTFEIRMWVNSLGTVENSMNKQIKSKIVVEAVQD